MSRRTRRKLEETWASGTLSLAASHTRRQNFSRSPLVWADTDINQCACEARWQTNCSNPHPPTPYNSIKTFEPRTKKQISCLRHSLITKNLAHLLLGLRKMFNKQLAAGQYVAMNNNPNRNIRPGLSIWGQPAGTWQSSFHVSDRKKFLAEDRQTWHDSEKNCMFWWTCENRYGRDIWKRITWHDIQDTTAEKNWVGTRHLGDWSSNFSRSNAGSLARGLFSNQNQKCIP